MKIILHAASFRKPFGIVCSLVTASAYSHASIIDNNDHVFDAVFWRDGWFGKFGRANALACQPQREIVVIDLGNDYSPTSFIAQHLNNPYDIKGLLLWPWKIQNPKKLYCFEAIDECLKSVGINLMLNKRKSGSDILHGLLNKGFKIRTMQGKHYNKVFKK